ncbi:hypothetical protein Bca4012_072368 [Brassica carinata]
MNWHSYLLIVRRRHGDVCASFHHQSISNQTFRSTGKTTTETFLNDLLLIDEQVVRSFEDDDIYHVGGKVNPTSDLDFINLKLIFCDLDQICKILERLTKCKARGFTI